MKQFSNLKRAFLPCLFVLLTLPAWGQMQPVTKNFRKTPLKNVLKEVEAQTGLSIMYDTRELNLERPVTASFDRTPVSQVLRDIFRYDTLVVGSPTYNGQLYPPVDALLRKIAERCIPHRRFACFGSFNFMVLLRSSISSSETSSFML